MEKLIKEFLVANEVKCIIVCGVSNIDNNVLNVLRINEHENALFFSTHFEEPQTEFCAICYNDDGKSDSIMWFETKSKLLRFKDETKSFKQLYLEY